MIRHALPDRVEFAPDGADPALTAVGRRQAAQLAAFLASHPYRQITRVVSSTMLRTRQTAQPLADALNLRVEEDPRLVEVNAGWTQYGKPMSV